MPAVADFKEIWLVDFEFHQPDGARPRPICLVAREFRSDRTIRLWEDDLQQQRLPPYPCGREALFVAYYASAELACHLSLKWPLPAYLLDLFVEFRRATNGLSTLCGSGLLGALIAYGLDGIEAVEKDAMRALAIRGGPWTAEERRALLDYCESDVVALRKLLSTMLPHIDFPRALLRGRYARAVAHMEWNGTPINVDQLHTLRLKWTDLQEELIRRIDVQYNVYDGTTFKLDRWLQWVQGQSIWWPLLPSGQLDLKEKTFRDMARIYPQVNAMKELRATLAQLRLEKLAVGPDGRNRPMLSPFRARTGRNQPSNTKNIFGPSVWLRGLIRPEPGCGIAYIDWEQQEHGIAAALSGDAAMRQAYESGDPYLAFARQAKAVPDSATKATHSAERERFKQCSLAIQYGMGHVGLASRIGQTSAHARALLRAHHQTYPTFWRWLDAVVDHALLHRQIRTVYGWTLHLNGEVNLRSLQNFPMQAHGAEMLRLACCLATEEGVEICAPVHDAVLVSAPLDDLEHAITVTERCMKQASEAVLDGFALRTDAKRFRHPEHYEDARGKAMWSLVWDIIHSRRGPLAA